ncbi:hypothetical protein K1T71_004695 [Dendrolimus kikuchii]|uniref:Uncharacterized protein n=1 Tax=Dendrolimus kikuchii TaxID=765133 RepID=A0ACC1D847_9NEOP|nr:hypothetical protein K1T71_004695 [Dendrolimus kikuchii]
MATEKDDVLNEKSDNHYEEFTEEDPLEENVANKEAKRPFFQTCLFVLENVTVEPSMCLFIMGALIAMLTTQNLNLEKACRVNLNYSDEICTSLKTQEISNQNEYEKNAQILLASALAWRTYLSATIPCIIALFVGSWSDKTGHRKMFMIISMIGQFLICINNMINVYFFYELRLEVLVFSEAILEGFTGGWCVCFLSAFAYIGAVTTDETRTFRIGIINFCLTVGFPIGMGLSGVFLKNYGYYGSYGLAASLHFLNIVYNVFILKDPKRSKEQKKHDGKGVLYFVRSFFDLRNVRDTLSVVSKKAPNNRRMRLIILLCTVSILFGPLYGEISILYMSTRYRFNWDEVKFSIFQTYNFVTHTVGTIFSILVFSRYLQWHDSILGIISTVSKIAASFVYCFAPNEKIFFFAPLVEILNGTSLLAMRSIFSKLVSSSELGKMNSIIGLTENLMPLLYVPLYTKIYAATMEVLPGAAFLVGAGMTFPAVIVFSWLLYEHRKGLSKAKVEAAVE